MPPLRDAGAERSRDLERGVRRKRNVDRRRFLALAAAGSVSLALETPLLAALAKGMPFALVTADLESHVVALDLRTTGVVKRIRTGPGPRAIELVRGSSASGVVVAHTEHGAVTVLGASSLSIRAELDGFGEPRYACSGSHTRGRARSAIAYVTDSGAEEVVALEVTGRCRVLARTRVPGPARHISITPDGRTIWTVLGNAAPRIAVLDASDPKRPRLVRTFAAPFLAHDVVFAPDGRSVWVTSGSERRIALYSGSRRPDRVLVAGAAPQHVAFTWERAFVASGDDGTVRRHRLDGDLVREARVPFGSHNLAFGRDTLVTPSLDQGTVTFLDRNGVVRATRNVARAAHDVCILNV
jgi:hypothetical protein